MGDNDDLGLSQLEEIEKMIGGDDEDEEIDFGDSEFVPEDEDDIVDLSDQSLVENGHNDPGASRPTTGAHSRIRSVIECMEEISPVVKDSVMKDEPEQEISMTASALYEHVEYISQQLGLDQEKLYDRYLTRRLALILSPLVRQIVDLGISKEQIFDVVTHVHDNTVDEDSALDMLSNNESSDDVLVTIRLGLLRPAVRLTKLLSDLAVDPLMRDASLRWMYDQSVKLAQDMAINWDRSATLFDRENLFASSIEICADFCIEAWVGYLVEAVEARPMPALSNEAIWARCESLESTISEISAGYGDHKEFPVSDLRVEFSDFIRQQISAYAWEGSVPAQLRNVLRGAILPRIEDVAVFSWTDAWGDVEGKIASMSEEDFAIWSSSEENQKPMPFSSFIRKYEDGCQMLPNPLDEIEIEFDLLNQKTQSMLAILWGFSDAVCTIKHQEG